MTLIIICCLSKCEGKEGEGIAHSLHPCIICIALIHVIHFLCPCIVCIVLVLINCPLHPCVIHHHIIIILLLAIPPQDPCHHLLSEQMGGEGEGEGIAHPLRHCHHHHHHHSFPTSSHCHCCPVISHPPTWPSLLSIVQENGRHQQITKWLYNAVQCYTVVTTLQKVPPLYSTVTTLSQWPQHVQNRQTYNMLESYNCYSHYFLKTFQSSCWFN